MSLNQRGVLATIIVAAMSYIGLPLIGVPIAAAIILWGES
jgi:hypothetical protein